MRRRAPPPASTRRCPPRAAARPPPRAAPAPRSTRCGSGPARSAAGERTGTQTRTQLCAPVGARPCRTLAWKAALAQPPFLALCFQRAPTLPRSLLGAGGCDAGVAARGGRGRVSAREGALACEATLPAALACALFLRHDAMFRLALLYLPRWWAWVVDLQVLRQGALGVAAGGRAGGRTSGCSASAVLYPMRSSRRACASGWSCMAARACEPSTRPERPTPLGLRPCMAKAPDRRWQVTCDGGSPVRHTQRPATPCDASFLCPARVLQSNLS